jgi:hypothetical protein
MTANPRVRQFVLVLGLASAAAACGDRESREADRDGSRYGGTVVIANNSTSKT